MSNPSAERRPDSRVDAEIRALTKRLEGLEGLVLGLMAAVSGVLLVVGSLLPFVTYVENREPVTYSIAGFGFAAAAFRSEEGGVDRVGVIFAVAFIGLLVVVLAAIGSLVTIARRTATHRTEVWAAVISTVLLIGIAGVWATVLLFLSRADDFTLHSGPLVLTLGALSFAVIVRHRAVRRLWEH